jgi:hypothetical protein
MAVCFMMLRSLAPFFAAVVAKPLRSEWPLNSAASMPAGISRAQAGQALGGNRARVQILPHPLGALGEHHVDVPGSRSHGLETAVDPDVRVIFEERAEAVSA